MSKTEHNRATLELLHEQLLAAVTYAFETAYAVDEGCGTSPEWAALCGQWGVELIDETQRNEARAAQRPLRGAPLMEFEELVRSMVKGIRRETKKVDTWDDPHDVRVMKDRLDHLIGRIEGELSGLYRAEVLPKRQGMFANATMHHDGAQKSSWDKARAHVFKCKTCGGPRLKASDTICPYCDNPMA